MAVPTSNDVKKKYRFSYESRHFLLTFGVLAGGKFLESFVSVHLSGASPPCGGDGHQLKVLPKPKEPQFFFSLFLDR